jgi:hypothetical protein
VYSRHSTQNRPALIKWPCSKHNDYDDMILTLTTSNSSAGNATWEHAVILLVDIIQTLMCFNNWSSIFKRLDVYHSRHMRVQVTNHGLYRRQPMKMPQLWLWNKCCKAHTISYENWDYPKPESPKYLLMTNCMQSPGSHGNNSRSHDNEHHQHS